MSVLRIQFEPEDGEDVGMLLEYDTARGENFFMVHVNQFGVYEVVDTDSLLGQHFFDELRDALPEAM